MSSATILDRDATCVSGPRVGEVSDFSVCVDDETGILLRASGETPDGTFEVEALEFTRPDPAMFEAPAEVAPPVGGGDQG